MTHMYFSARTEGRIPYGHLGRTNSCFNRMAFYIIICLHTVLYIVFENYIKFGTSQFSIVGNFIIIIIMQT